MPITLAELKDRLQQLFPDGGSGDLVDVQAKLGEFMQYSVEHYDMLDEEAKSYIDRVFQGLQKEAVARADSLPDGPEKRRILRQLSLAGGGHYQAENLIAILESTPQTTHPIIPAARQAFAQLLQRALDVLFDVTRHSHEGMVPFAQIGLCTWAIDELLAAIRLAQCAFTNQSYAHIRTVFEIMDLIELFRQQPELATLWVSGDDKKVWTELRPKAVRKKLGEPRDNPMYSFLSEHGSHGTFRGLQARSGQSRKQGDADRNKVTVWVGGSPMVHHVVWTNSLCVYTALQLLVKTTGVFANYLNEHEMSEVLQASADLLKDFFRTHYVEWAKGEGLDYETMLEFLNGEPWRVFEAAKRAGEPAAASSL